jgi:hypothetical protein
VKGRVRESNARPNRPERGSRLQDYLGRLHEDQRLLLAAWEAVGARHADEPAIRNGCARMAAWTERHFRDTKQIVARHGSRKKRGPAAGIRAASFKGKRDDPVGILEDLHDLALLLEESRVCWTVVTETASALRDQSLQRTGDLALEDLKRQRAWLADMLKQAAPQALVVPAPARKRAKGR